MKLKTTTLCAIAAPALGLAFGLLASSAAVAEDLPTLLGKVEYRTNCRVCHGEEGKGNGPLASELKTAPINLQMISKNNNGEFPTSAMYELIDGRKSVRAHGTSDMPVWGAVYSAKIASSWAGDSDMPGPNVEAAINGKILSLIYYLRSIQAK